jgi:DNA-binding beta-propeller fold protein YncE
MRHTHSFPLHRLAIAATAALVLWSGVTVQAADRDAGTVAAHAPVVARSPVALTLEKIGGTAAAGLGASEINSYDPATKRLFVTNGALGTVDVLDLADPTAPRLAATLDISDLGSGANSVAVHDGLVALAVETSPKTDPGKVVFYRADNLARLAVVPVGAQPDMLVFSHDGRRVLVANEGEPNSYGFAGSVDPEGSISIIELNRRGRWHGQGQQHADAHRPGIEPRVRTADFIVFNSQIDTLRAQGVRIYGPGASVAQDLEPEYIALDPDGRHAYVVLQENNAIATVDIQDARVLSIRALGLKNHSLPGQGLDPSDEDAGTDTNSGTPAVKIGNWPLQGMYLPDGLAAYKARGQTYLVTANEGDARADWPGFNEEVRIRAHCDKGLDPAVFTGATGNASDPLLKDSNLGRLRVTLAPNGNDSGKNAAGQCNKLWNYGARSFSIWRAADMTRVFDSGEDFERITAALAAEQGAPFKFNSGHDNDTLDSRSPAKGPEPEGVTLGEIAGRTYAFIGLERVGGVMVYDISDPAKAVFATYVNTRNGLEGDRGPEGLTFVPARQSPNGKPLLIVSNEVSGSTAVLQVNLGHAPKRH